jgi:hypothetical protein
MLTEPAYRNLRGYTLDPGFSTMLDTSMINETIYRIRWENVTPGPKGEYFEVIDFDPPSKCFYEPVDLNDYRVMAENGLNPSEGDPFFHQQQVYVTGMKTLTCFEQSLGRKVIWKPRRLNDDEKKIYNAGVSRTWKKFRSGDYTEEQRDARLKKLAFAKFKREYVGHLRLFPHAFRGANAYYTAEKQAVLFGYFQAGEHIGGTNLPGGVVFTCLSPDIVAHEITHAILDSIHPNFMDENNEDVAAFHEAFADLIALLQRFTIHDLLEHQLARSKGKLDEFNLMGELATQFGNALQEGRGALRSAIGTKVDGQWKKYDPDPSLYKTQFECHERGALLVAVIYDAFIRLYKFKTQDLFRIANNNATRAEGASDNVSVDLVKRLAAEAAETARHLLQICIRALDYCPPFDIDFGDYLRALITADRDVAPADNDGYRIALMEAFRAWGIFPERVNTLSVESLTWTRKPYAMAASDEDEMRKMAQFLKPRVRDLLDIQDRKELAFKSRWVQQELHAYLNDDKKKSNERESFLQKLGLSREKVELKYTEDEKYEFENIPIEVHSVRPAYRIGREGKQLEQVVITITQTVTIENDQSELNGMKFKGGCTVILNMRDNYDVEYTLVKNIKSDHRFRRQAEYQTGKSSSGIRLTNNLYDDDNAFHSLDFAKLHFHTY